MGESVALICLAEHSAVVHDDPLFIYKSWESTALIPTSDASMSRIKGLLGLGYARMGAVISFSLRVLKACSSASIHQKVAFFSINLTRGLDFHKVRWLAGLGWSGLG